jgi:hypothetical protein
MAAPETGRCGLERHEQEKRIPLPRITEGIPGVLAFLITDPHPSGSHSTWSWHLGQIHMPLGIVFRGGSKQSRWYTREHVSHISNWPLFLQTLQKSSWISPYEIERKGKKKDKKVKIWMLTCTLWMHIYALGQLAAMAQWLALQHISVQRKYELPRAYAFTCSIQPRFLKVGGGMVLNFKWEPTRKLCSCLGQN